MKQIILNFLKKTLVNELRDMFNRNTTYEERTMVTNWLLKVRDKAKDGIAKDVLNIILQSLN